MTPREIADLVVAALAEATQSPGQVELRWQLKPAQAIVADAVNPIAVFDGDGALGSGSTPVPLTSLIGHVAVDGRVMVLTVPPDGNFAVADISGATSESTFDATEASTTSGSFTTVGGTVVGLSFIVPASGKVQLTWGGEISNSVGSFSLLSPEIAEGGTVGSGTVIVAASDDYTARADTTVLVRSTNMRLVTVADGAGFIPGKLVNVALYHRVGAGTGNFDRRTVTVVPVR